VSKKTCNAPGGGLICPAYLGATGLVEGGPARGAREALAASHPVAMTLVAAFDGYEKKIVDPARRRMAASPAL
jgi:hypothetical protein